MIVSTVMLTLLGWAVTALKVEPRLRFAMTPDLNQPGANTQLPNSARLDNEERRGLTAGIVSGVTTVAVIVALTTIPGAPLQGVGTRFPRWIEAAVPILFLVFFIPSIAYGIGARTIRSDKDIARMMGETISSLGSYIVLAFFAAQFIEFFKFSHLGEMLAILGGQTLAEISLPSPLLVTAFMLVTVVGNLFIGSASAKYAFFAPVFVPMFMQVGISPELTQAAYRVGDSVSNVITPLNPYIIIILAFMQ